MNSLPISLADPSLTRRRWIRQFMLGSAAAMVVGRPWRATLLADISPDAPPSNILPIALSDYPSLLDGPGQSVQFRLSVNGVSEPEEVITINIGFDGNFIVLDSRCSHQGCTVNKWNLEEGMVCPCHFSRYDIDGSLIFGVTGPGQPGLTRYNFSYDGGNLLLIEIPGLNLKVNGIAVESMTPTNKRLRLSFPTRQRCDYRVLFAPDLAAPFEPVFFATSATGLANQEIVRALTTAPLEVWVDDPAARGFYRIELVLVPV